MLPRVLYVEWGFHNITILKRKAYMGQWASCLTGGTLASLSHAKATCWSPPTDEPSSRPKPLCCVTVMSILFLRGHAAPPCAPDGTCACSVPLHERGGGSLTLFIALRSRPSACLAPTCGGGGGMPSLCLRPSLRVCGWAECVRAGVLGAPWRSSAALLCG